YHGPRGLRADYASVETSSNRTLSVPRPVHPVQAEEPGPLQAWTAFHAQVERLANEEKEVFDLLWYLELSQAGVAELLKVSERTVKRPWVSARLRLHNALRRPIPANLKHRHGETRSEDSRLLEMVVRSEELRAADQTLAVEELCRECPELLPALRARL